MKTALLLCASHNDLGLIRSLRKLGYYIITTGNTPNLTGQILCDEYIQADYSNKELILKIARDRAVDAICQCCNDFGVYTASYVAEAIGLPGYDSYETTLLLHNKDKFKSFAKLHRIPGPRSESFLDQEDAAFYLHSVKYPIIVKPVDASAGKGILRANTYDEAIGAVNNAFAASKSKRIVIEPFIEGSQHGFCTFLINQRVVAHCSNNEYSFLNPYRVEIDTFPADNHVQVSELIIKEIEKIASLLHLKDGIFHLQYIFDGKDIFIIEVMRRILGNMYHVPGNLLTGIDWEYWETRAKCGLSCSTFPNAVFQEGFFAYKAILSDCPGVIQSIDVLEKYKKYLCGSFLIHDTGYTIENNKSNPIGFLFFMFPSRKTMDSILLENYSNDIIVMKEMQ